MTSLRLWILGVAAGSFGAGLLVGHTVTHATCVVETSPEDAAYAAKLTSDYGLSSEQQHRLRLVLQAERDAEAAIRHQAVQLSEERMNELRALRKATEQRVRKLLDDEQRRRYDRDSRPASAPAAADQR
jgi:hypothetical protein